MRPFREAFPGSWSAVSEAVRGLREKLFGEIPSIDPVDISDIVVPAPILRAIKAKNLRRVRDEIGVEEMTADGSPYRTDAFFDDQLLEVVASINHRYAPLDFIRQMVKFIEIFTNESAAFHAARVVSRITDEDADQVVDIVRTAVEATKDEDIRKTLYLLLVDLAEGGDEPWAQALSPPARAFLDRAMAAVG